MKSHEIRKKLLKKGTLLGLSGDYNAPSIWGKDKLLSMTLSKYLIVERHDKILEDSHNTNLDIGIIAIRETPIRIHEIDGDNTFYGNKFLLLHRYTDLDWDNQDPNVQVFGLSNDVILTSPLLIKSWHPNAAWLSAAGVMCVIDSDKMSEMGTFFTKKYEVI